MMPELEEVSLVLDEEDSEWRSGIAINNDKRVEGTVIKSIYVIPWDLSTTSSVHNKRNIASTVKRI